MENLNSHTLFPDIDLEIALLAFAQRAYIDLFKLRNKPYKPRTKADVNMFKDAHCSTCTKNPRKCIDFLTLRSAVGGGCNENIVVKNDQVYCVGHSNFKVPK